jgi:hypothetical protein
MGLELQDRLYESYPMRHPELRLLWQAMFLGVAFEISLVIVLVFVTARREGAGRGPPGMI